MGEKSAQNVLDNIEASKARPLTRVLFALGIRYVGYQTAELLARAFGSMDRLREASLEDILAVEGIGPKIAESVYAWFHEADGLNLGIVDKLVAAGVNMSEDAAALSGPLAGLTIVVTGTPGASQPHPDRAVDQRPGRRHRRLGVEENELSAGRRGGRLQAGESAKLGTPILDEAGFETLVAERSHA